MSLSFGHFLRSHRLVLTIFVVAVTLTAVFSFRAIAHFVYFQDPAHREQPIAGWMTPRYVAMSHGVPPAVVRQAIGERQRGGRATLEAIAAERDQSLDALIDEIEAAIDAHEEGHQRSGR